MNAARRQFSLEFFPPRTPEGVARLAATRAQLAQLKPAFCSVTFGAGGSTREGTLATVLEFRTEGMEAAPHISCIGSTRETIAGQPGEILSIECNPARDGTKHLGWVKTITFADGRRYELSGIRSAPTTDSAT